VTLSDLERHNNRHYVLFYRVRHVSEPNCVKFTKVRFILSATKSNPDNLVFGNIWFVGPTQSISVIAELVLCRESNSTFKCRN